MRRILLLLPATLLAACGHPAPEAAPSPSAGSMAEGSAAPNTLTAADRRAGWRLLFDGRTMAGWRGYMKPDLPPGWQATDGTISRTAPSGDIITTAKYRNFELSLEWKLSTPGGNSGVFYRAIEGPDAIYYSAPEMQVLDDEVHPDGKSQLTSAGAAYGLYPAPRGAVKPLGQWNLARILVNGNHVEHWLNGVKMADYELGSADWQERVMSSKFKRWPEYGKAAEGFIGLQDHENPIAFRSIKIRVLP